MYKCMQGCRKWGGRGSQDRPSLKAREAWPLILHAHTNVHGPKTGKHLLQCDMDNMPYGPGDQGMDNMNTYPQHTL